MKEGGRGREEGSVRSSIYGVCVCCACVCVVRVRACFIFTCTLGRGPESKISESMEAPPLQFPRMVPHVFDMTRNACVFLTNSRG